MYPEIINIKKDLRRCSNVACQAEIPENSPSEIVRIDANHGVEFCGPQCADMLYTIDELRVEVITDPKEIWEALGDVGAPRNLRPKELWIRRYYKIHENGNKTVEGVREVYYPIGYDSYIRIADDTAISKIGLVGKRFESLALHLEIIGVSVSVCDTCERTYPEQWIVNNICPFCGGEHTCL